MEIKPEIETFAKIKVIGVGGGGSSAVNRMIEEKIRGVATNVIGKDRVCCDQYRCAGFASQ